MVVGTHPKDVGDVSTAMVTARLVQAGKSLLVPFGENQRYDLVIDEQGDFVRVQCKTGRVYRGVIWFPTCSSTYHHPNNQGKKTYKHAYAGQADVFGVYCPETDRVYIVPVSEVGSASATLRVNPPRNGQSKGIRWAHDFELKFQSPG
jgi:hypothetical protein